MAVADDMVLDFRPIGGTEKERVGKWGCQHCINVAMYASPTVHGAICPGHFNEDELKVLNSRETIVPKVAGQPSV
jgi:hypothetical protein